jgi:diketogulonate reductase-like aldo/keto reductase
MNRDDIFITTKLAPVNQGSKNCESSVLKSLKELNTDYIDLLLIHWPGTAKLTPSNDQNKTSRRESWLALEDLHSTHYIWYYKNKR